jgi:hypothetical protein
MQQPTAHYPPDNREQTSHLRVAPGPHCGLWEHRREQDDHAADEVVAPEMCRRRGAADHADVAAERVVEAISRVPGRPEAERESHSPWPANRHEAPQQTCVPRALLAPVCHLGLGCFRVPLPPGKRLIDRREA